MLSTFSRRPSFTLATSALATVFLVSAGRGQEGTKTAAYFLDNQHTTRMGTRLDAEAVIVGLNQLKNHPLERVLLQTSKTTLWNGKDLSGWRTFLGEPKAGEAKIEPGKVWSVADGSLRLDAKTSGYVVTEKSYSDYHLHVEWRWLKGAAKNSNSGILLHVHGPDAIWPTCLECQLASGNAGQVVGMGLDIPTAPLIQNRKRAPRLTDSSEKPVGEWNACDVHARGDTIEVFVNGVRQNKVEKLPAKSGGIGLQMEGFPIEFKEVWLEPATAGMQ